jgi:hypothetical protein
VKRYALPAIVGLGLVVRVPFWVEALRTPLDGDQAILGLMARHPLQSTTMWGQPYGSPIEAWIAAPVLAALGPTTAALRLVYFLLGLALIPVAGWMAGALDRRAILPAALVAALPSPYFLLLSALPPPMYPSALLMAGLLLGSTVRLGAALDGDKPLSRPAAALWGLLAGLALWTHLMTGAVVLPCFAYMLARGRRARRFWPMALAAFSVAAAPLAWNVAREGTLRIVSTSGRGQEAFDHVAAVVPEMHRPVAALLGTHVPWIADDPSFVVFASTTVAFALVALQGVLLVLAFAARPPGPVRLFLAVIVLTLVAFPFPVRSSPSAVRFLTPAYLPLVAVVCWAAVVQGNARRAAAAGLALGALNLMVGTRLLSAWRAADRAEEPFLLPDLRPLRRELEAHGIRRVYASYVPAYRLTFESGERIVASQPWNDRFLHHPLPYLDEVRFARNVAWVLMPRLPSDLPAPRTFEDQLGAIGGRAERTDIAGAAVFHSFVPPMGATVAPLASAGMAGDASLDTAVTAAGADGSLQWSLSPAQPLSGLTLVAGLSGPRLPRGFDLEISADGVAFERVVRRRRREERQDLRWLNGHPQYVIDDDCVSVAVAGRTVAAVRLTPIGDEPWALAEVLLHGATTPAPWDEWLDPAAPWSERMRRLESVPRLDRADWYARRLLAERHR